MSLLAGAAGAAAGEGSLGSLGVAVAALTEAAFGADLVAAGEVVLGAGAGAEPLAACIKGTTVALEAGFKELACCIT